MDTLTHTLCGVVIGLAATKIPAIENQQFLCYAIAITSSLIPDSDTVSKLGGNQKYLKAHRRWTHQIQTLPFFALLLSLIALLIAKDHFWWFFLLSSFSIFIHLFLDSLNPYGTKLLPFYHHIKLNVLASVDIFILLLLIIAIPIIILRNNFYILLSIPIYILIRVIAHFIIRLILLNHDKEIKTIHVLSTYNPFKWHIIEEYEGFFIAGSFITSLYNIDYIQKARITDETFDLIKTTKEFKTFRDLSYAYFIEEYEEQDYTVVRIFDLKYRKGDYYYFQLLFFIKNHEITHSFLGFVFSDEKFKAKTIKRPTKTSRL